MGTALKKKETQFDFDRDTDPHGLIKNNLDKAIFQTLCDSKDENDEPLRLLEKSLFDSKRPVDRLDLEDSVVLKLTYRNRS